MGIDMFAFVEIKEEKDWEWELLASFVSSRRDHLLFSVLGGEGNSPEALKLRGLPEETSFRVKRKYDLSSPGYSSTSWMSFRDLKLAYGRYEKRRKEEKGKKNFELEGMMGLMERLEKLQVEIRLVFWFSY